MASLNHHKYYLKPSFNEIIGKWSLFKLLEFKIPNLLILFSNLNLY